MENYKIIMNGRLVIGNFKAETKEKAVEIAREYVSDYSKRAWAYDNAWPNSVLIESKSGLYRILKEPDHASA